MFKIRHATDTFARLDQTPEEGVKSLDQALRHLTQRLPSFAPATRAGRADLYPLTAICALRLLYKADGFGLEWRALASLSNWLQSANPLGRRVLANEGLRPMSPIEEAIERVRAGQDFDFNLTLYCDGHMAFGTDWAADDPDAEAVADRVLGHILPDVTFTIHASRLIGELLAELEGAEV